MEIDIRNALDDDALMLETYTYSVSDKFNYETRNIAKKKLVYIFTESLADMGLKNMNSIAFQITLFVIILSFWSRLYMHYFGEYLALLMCGIPVSMFEAKWYTVVLYYEAWQYYQEIVVICLGVLFNTLLFLIFMTAAYIINKYRLLPHIFYKMICWYGIATAIDFLLIFIVDCIEQRWSRGDMFKLYYYYNKRDGYGYPGIAMTVFCYAVLLFVNLSLLYYYLIFVHMGGRVIDIYHRLSGNVNHFFLPHDEEISLSYLKWVCAKALRFNHRVSNSSEEIVDERGNKVMVHFIHVYKFDKETHELFTHRSFIRDYDGSIREVHILKKILDEDAKQGIVGNLPPRPDRQRYFREQHYDLSKDDEKKEGNNEEEKVPEEQSFKQAGVDSKMNLKDDNSSDNKNHDSMFHEDNRLVGSVDEEED